MNMTHDELIKTEEYILTHIQINFFTMINEFMKLNKLNRKEACKYFEISPNKLKTILNGDYDGKISEFCRLHVKCGLNMTQMAKIEDIEQKLIKGEL